MYEYNATVDRVVDGGTLDVMVVEKDNRKKYAAVELAMYQLKKAGYKLFDKLYWALVNERALLEKKMLQND